MENLIRAGAFDSITPNRRQLMESMPGMFELAQRRNDDCHSQQLLELEDLSEEEGPVLFEVEDYDLHTRMEMEKEATGLYISGHPFDKYEKEVLPYTTCSITDLSFWRSEDCTAVVAGILAGVQEKFTRKGDRMGILELEDSSGKVEVVCFPRTWSSITPPEKGKAVVVKGSPRTRDGLSLIAEKVMAVDELDARARKWLRLRVLDDGASSNGRLRDIYRELKGHPGEAGVLLEVPLEGVKALLKVRDVFVEPSADLSTRISELSGGCVEVV